MSFLSKPIIVIFTILFLLFGSVFGQTKRVSDRADESAWPYHHMSPIQFLDSLAEFLPLPKVRGNQGCELTASVRFAQGETVSIEELFSMVEQAASAQVFPIIKREDEKRVTEQAWDNPKFVEDSVRDLANTLKNEPRIVWFRCSSENFESIHNHNAHAEIEFNKALG